MALFPYPFRKNQQAILATIKKTLHDGNHLIFESGTGSGKTVCALFSTLEYALKNNKKIIYTTRTNAQQRQVIVELRQIRNTIKPTENQILGIGLQGRGNMCLLARNNPEFFKGTSEELSRLCSHEKKKTLVKKAKDQGCKYFRNYKDKPEKVKKIIEWVTKNLPTTEEFIEKCEKQHLCPYEINKILLKEANVVVVPFIYVFDPMIRNMLLDWLGFAEKDLVLIVDEAHNLPDYLRELYSSELSMWMLKNCLIEADKHGDPALGGIGVCVSEFLKLLTEIISDMRDTYIYGVLENGLRREITHKSDAFIPSHELETEILSRFKITSKKLGDIIADLIAYGEKIQEYRQKEGKLPRSYLHKLGVFLEFWTNIEMDQYVKLIVDDTEGRNPRIEAYCLDPSLGAKVIKGFHSSIHMSGTLEPLEEYRDSLGFALDTELVAYPSPFPKNNRRVLYATDVTTRYEEIKQDASIVNRIRQYITLICNDSSHNTMVFFPSFDTLSLFLRKGLRKNINRCLYVEEQGMSQGDLMNVVSSFKQSKTCDNDGAALFSVMGGRISEGMDFPAKELEIAVIVGIPYPKPTARQRGLQNYYEYKFGKGWDYTVMAPTARKLVQSIGRLIRDETDRGVAIILDRRAPRFKKYIPDISESKNLLQDIRRFIK